MKKHLLFLFAALLPLVASAQTKVEIDGIWYNLVSKAKVAEVTSGGNYTGSITIPATVTYDGVVYSVTSIGSHAFFECSRLTAINIPANSKLTSIGGYAFSGCSSLTAINIPEGVTSIGWGAFYYCSRLTAVHISSIEAWCKISFGSYESNPLYYAHNLYLNGELVTELVIPEGVTSIGNYAFSGCSSLTAITLPEGVTSIGDKAFEGCRSLTAINIPGSVTSIGDRAFLGCSSLTAINIPEGVTSIGNYAFDSCSSLTAINIPEGVTSIGDHAFYKCSSLTAINIPESLTSIERYAFAYCSSLTAINIPEGVTSIGSGAFIGCSSLTAINIPEGVTSIGSSVFLGCSSLTAINIPEGVTSIGEYAFYECSNLTAINIPEGVTSIGAAAFGYCSNLTAINIPEGVTSIENSAFVDCSSLASINIPEGVTSIGSGAFYNCSSLTTVVLPKSVKSIGWKAFANCAELTHVYCHAESVPSTTAEAFEESYPGKATLHVPASAINDYKTTAPWSEFGSIVALEEEGTAPTEVSITINQYGSGTYCSEYALDFSKVEGLKAYAATGYNSITGVVTLLRLNTSQPGEGLFIKGEPGKYMVPIMESTGDHTTNMLVGTLTKTAVNATSGDGLYANYKYTIKEGDSQPLFYRFNDGSTLGAGKAYLQIPMAWLPQTSEAKSISLRFEEGEGTTDIDALTLNPQPSTEVYDLYGRRVDNPVKGGIYIVGGKKVVVK